MRATAPAPAPPPVARPASRRRLGWLWPVTLALLAVPAAKLALDAATGGLGANPIAEGMNRLGFWTLTLLLASLTPTPLHDLLGLRWPVRVRRVLGLAAFAYATLHLAWYLVVDQFFDWVTISRDLTKRPFIAVGFSAFLVLVPLAVTSADRWVRRLGYARWKRLHRLVYAAALLGAVHFLWRVKADHRRPAIFAAVLAALFGARLFQLARTRLRRALPRPAQEARPRQY